MTRPCQFKLSPTCKGIADVMMTGTPACGAICIECGKAYQQKFPHRIDALTITPLKETDQ